MNTAVKITLIVLGVAIIAAAAYFFLKDDKKKETQATAPATTGGGTSGTIPKPENVTVQNTEVQGRPEQATVTETETSTNVSGKASPTNGQRINVAR